jgi:hypothetical protein
MSWPQGCLDVIPLIRPSDTFSPIGGEGRDEGAPPNRIHQLVYRSGHSFIETALAVLDLRQGGDGTAAL